MNNYLVVIPETMVSAFVQLLPGVHLVPIGVVMHAHDPEQKKYLINIEPKKDHENTRTD